MLYHYTKRSTALDHILRTGHLRLSLFYKTNDTRESKAWSFPMTTFGEVSEPREFFEFQTKADLLLRQTCKIACFTTDDRTRAQVDGKPNFFGRGFARSRMWSQYSEFNAGVCILFSSGALREAIRDQLKDKGLLYGEAVIYDDGSRGSTFQFNLDEVRKQNLEDVLEQHVRTYYRELFFAKDLDWDREREFRWVLWDSSQAPVFVSIKSAIRGVVVGDRFPKVYAPTLDELVEGLGIAANTRRCIWENGQPKIGSVRPLQ